MKKILTFSIILPGLFSVIAQYFLMMENRVTSVAETTVRFFSFFTILTNSIVVLYFTARALGWPKNGKTEQEANTTTAITMYITIVGLVYQILLRQTWDPTGLQKVVDELLHSLIPLLVIVYWVLYTAKAPVSYRRIPRWLLFPFLYLCYILLLGSFSGFYPYPFVHVGELGMRQVLINATGLMFFFVGVSVLFVMISGAMEKRKRR